MNTTAQQARLAAFEEVLEAVIEMEKAYEGTGFTVGKKDVLEYMLHELGRGKR